MSNQKGNASLPGPVVSTFTDKDTSFAPSSYVGAVVAYSSPWIDLCSPDPVIANISRQVLNLEVAYANFCGARSIVIPGPRKDGNGRDIALYARAVQEALIVAVRANLIIHLPMYREPGLEEQAETLTTALGRENCKDAASSGNQEIDLFGTWDTWNTIRSVCNYSARLFVGTASSITGYAALRITHES